MIERLTNIERRLAAMTDPDDESCTIPDEVKNAIRPFVGSWVAPDVEALLRWARGEKTINETARLIPMSKAPKQRPRT